MIRINNLTKAYGENSIFTNFDLLVEEGEMVAITGVSGKGKSTLLNIIGSLESFQSGLVEVNNKNIKKMKHREQLQFLKNDVSFLFQNYALMENHNVYDNIVLGRKGKDIKTLVEDVLDKVGLPGFERRMINTLSGGEQQRVALARAMLKPSKLILADEPTGNLDETNSKKVWDILLELKEIEKTILVVTHEKNSLHHFDRVINL